jgi:transcriptional regulatory protein RtcR
MYGDQWERWWPTVALWMHADLKLDRLVLIVEPRVRKLARFIAEDLERLSPETELIEHELELEGAWDFEEVYEALHSFARSHPFDLETEDYLT